MERGRLRVGDLILLKQSKGNEGWLSADGIIDLDSHLSPSATLENSLWQVTVQNQYSATTELEHALYLSQLDQSSSSPPLPLISSTSITDLTSPSTSSQQLNLILEKDSRLNQLNRTAYNEKKLNKKLMNMKIGKAISFGDVIQLLHIKSQKFLTVSPYLLAKHERENLRVYLKEDGDSMSWFELMPRYKYDKEGQPVANGNECLIRVHERSSDYLHTSKKNFLSTSGEDHHEINCSLESSVWTISIYQSANQMKSNALLSGHLVTFHEPETSTYLQIEPEIPSSLSSSAKSTSSRRRVMMSESVHLSLNTSSSSASSLQSIQNIGTQFLWQIESLDLLAGGVLHHSVGKYIFKNINTDLYLKLDSHGIFAVKHRIQATHFEIIVPYQMSYGQIIPDGTLTQITDSGRTIGFCLNSYGVFELGSCLLSDRMTLSFQISSKLQKQLSYQIYVGREASHILKQFHAHLISVHHTLTVTHGINTFSINLITDENLLKYFIQIESNIKELIVCLDYLKSYLQYSSSSSGSNLIMNSSLTSLAEEDEGFNKERNQQTKASSEFEKNVLGNQKEKMITIRQVMMREQGVLDILLAIVDLLRYQEEDIHLSYVGLLRHSYSIPNLNSSNLNRQNLFMPPEIIFKKKSTKNLPQPRSRSNLGDDTTIDKDLCRLCLHVLFLALNNNQLNQMYVADKFTVLLNQVKYQEYAVTCVREMLRDNRQMLQTKVMISLSFTRRATHSSTHSPLSLSVLCFMICRSLIVR
jgi:hypothetical protein